MRLGTSARRTEVEEEAKKLPPPEPPYRGLQEKNSLGFWEETQAEHDRWMTAKRIEIEDIKRRREEFEEKRRMEKKVIAPESLRRVIDETLAQVSERMPTNREPGEDEEDSVPF